MIKRILIIVILANLFLIGCSNRDIVTKLNGTWQQKPPGNELMILDFEKNVARFHLNNEYDFELNFSIVSKTENSIELLFDLKNGKTINCKFKLDDIDNNYLIGIVNEQTFYYYKLQTNN